MRFSALRFTTLLLPLMLILILTASRPSASLAQTDSKSITDEISTLTIPAYQVQELASAPKPPNFLQRGPAMTKESEPNGTPATANPIGTTTVIQGGIFPATDEDYFSFTANAGDKVYAGTMTSFSPGNSTDSQLRLFASDGTTEIEFDDDHGSFAPLSSTIANATIPTAGTYYLHIKDFTPATGQIRQYYLYFNLQSGAGVPAPEVEANDTPATANPLPVNGWVSGARNPAVATEQDWYSFTANAGDTVFLNLDLDPERDNVQWNGRLGIALFGDAGNQIPVVDDAGSGASAANPPAEAIYMTVKNSGTYFAFVDSATATVGGPAATYTLNVTVFPAQQEGVSCTTYASTDVPKTIGPANGMVSSTITVPGNPRIADIDVSIELNHAVMNQIDAHLRSPAGNDNGLFTDIGAAVAGGQIQMDLTLDDEAGIPFAFTVLKGINLKPENSTTLGYRLGWFDGENAGGTWTLDLYDDINDANGGTLTNWSIRICEPEPPPSCPIGTALTVVYSSDFEAGADGFTHSGTADEWELGLPATLATTGSPPIAAFNSCNSGTSCWKTDLDNTYDISSNQNLLSPNIDLTGLVAPVVVSWAQRYQMERANFDHANVTIQQVGGATPVRLWEWLDGDMTNAPGNPAVNIGASSGWSIYSARADGLAGLNSELLFHLDSDTTTQLGGLTIDDVSVTACMPVPTIELTKTVSTDNSCGATNNLSLPVLGGNVTYCYTVENTSSVTATTHTLLDDQLGTIFSNMPYTLPPGATTFVTQTVMITESVTNVAEWMASNGVVTGTATATATVTVDAPVYGVELSADLSASGQPGEVVTYTVSITNVGNISSGFMLTVEDSSWATTLSDSTVVLDVGEVDTFEAYVTIPLTATDGMMDTALVMATSAAGLAGGGVATDTIELTTTAVVNAVYGVELSADLSASGLPGEVVTYTVSITNVGNISSGFMLTVEDSSWATTLSDSTIVLDVGEVDSFEAYVTIPLTATDGMMDTALVMATSAAGLAGGGVATDTVELTTTAVVNAVYGVQLSADLSASGLPGEVVTYTVSITNVGNISSGFMLTVEDSSWATTLSDSTVVLDVGEVDSFEAYVTIPLTATDGMMDTALVMATSAAGLAGGGVATDTVELTTTAVENAVYGVDLSADLALTGTVDSMVTYTIWITNNGNVQDTFEIEATAVWTTTLSTSSVVVNAGEASEITVVVYIPATAIDLETDEATITATSQGDSNTNDVTHLTTTALEEPPAGYHLYLPVLNRH